MVNRILLSTDIGSDIDDALCLLSMLNHPDINLQGIYTVNGDVNSRSYIARHMVNLRGARIPVIRGEQKPIAADTKPYTYYESLLIDDSFLDKKKTEEENWNTLIYKNPERVGINTKGVEHLAKKLSKKKYTIFNISPLTNIAKLVQEYPEESKNIEKIVMMGCEISEGRVEHNIRYDPGAADIVFSSEIPLLIVPADVCDKYKASSEDLLKQMGNSKVGRYVKKMLLAFLGAKLAGEYRWYTAGGEGLDHILKNLVLLRPPMQVIKELGSQKIYDLDKFKEITLANLDETSAYLDTEDFWVSFRKLIEQLRDPKLNYKLGEKASEVLESLIPKEVSVSDVYVPFCFLHPEKLKTERLTLSCDFNGRTLILPRKKHEVVRYLDIDSLKEFLSKFIF